MSNENSNNEELAKAIEKLTTVIGFLNQRLYNIELELKTLGKKNL